MALSKTTATAMIQPTAACPAGGKGSAKTNPCRTLRIATATANRTVRERRSCFRVGMLGARLGFYYLVTAQSTLSELDAEAFIVKPDVVLDVTQNVLLASGPSETL